MLRNRSCWIVCLVVVAQVGIVLCYQGAMTGGASPTRSARSAGPAGKTCALHAAATEQKPKSDEPAPKDPPKSGPGDPGPSGSSKLADPPLPPAMPEKKEEDAAKEPMPPIADKKEGPGPAPESKKEIAPVAPEAKKDVPPPQETRPCLKEEATAPQATVAKPCEPMTPGQGTTAGGTTVGQAPKECVPTGPPSGTSEAAPLPSPVVSTGPVPAADKAAPLPTVVPTPEKRLVPVAVCPWTLRVAVIEGKTHLTAQSGKEVRFRVVCDQLNLQAPRGNIEAQGTVRLSSAGLDGSCDRLTICWQEDQVVLDGQAQLKCRRDGQDLELKAARLSLRLTPSGTMKAEDREIERTYNHKQVRKVKRVKKSQGHVPSTGFLD
jgi:hypothetical protein